MATAGAVSARESFDGQARVPRAASGVGGEQNPGCDLVVLLKRSSARPGYAPAGGFDTRPNTVRESSRSPGDYCRVAMQPVEGASSARSGKRHAERSAHSRCPAVTRSPPTPHLFV